MLLLGREVQTKVTVCSGSEGGEGFGTGRKAGAAEV